MARYTSVYGDFIVRLAEVGILRRKAALIERSRRSLQSGPEISALCRGAVVLLSSHVEAYVKELGEHTLDALYEKRVCRSKLTPQFFYHVSKERIENVRSSADPERIAGHMQTFVVADSAMWAKVGGLPAPVPSDAFNQGFSNPKFDKIKTYFARFGYSEFRRDFMRTLAADATKSMSALDQIVETRNSIAHGDPSATKTPQEVKDMEDVARGFCKTVDKIFSDWCKQNLCSIR